jgi:putative hydrolase of the HAD superfamily
MAGVKMILFDVGNVLLKLRKDEFLQKVEKACPALPRAVMDSELVKEGSVHLAYETGAATFKQFYSHLVKTYGLPWTEEVFLEHWRNYFSENPPMTSRVEHLAGKARLWVLSNTNAEHYAWFVTQFPVFRHFEKILGSHQLGARKPSSDIYATLLDRSGLDAEEIFFIDDMAENIEAARALGIRAFQYYGNESELDQALADAGIDRRRS